MIGNSRLKTVVVPLSALAVLLALACPRAEAEAKPFKVTGGGPAPEGLSLFGLLSPHSATGTATHLGKYSGNEGAAFVDTFDPLTETGTFHGSFVFVAANGDRLACNYGHPGTFGVIDVTDEGEIVVQFVAEFTYDPKKSTGQFANVTGGSFIMIATTEPFEPDFDPITGFSPPFNYTWEGKGTIEFGKGK